MVEGRRVEVYSANGGSAKGKNRNVAYKAIMKRGCFRMEAC